jgi:uncharacterized protein (DUF58 family)
MTSSTASAGSGSVASRRRWREWLLGPSPSERAMQMDLTPVHRRQSFDVSLMGMVYCMMMMFMGVAAVNSQAALLFGVFGLMIGITLVSAYVSKLVLRKLELHRLLPDQAIVGRPMVIHYSVSNQKRRWASMSVTVSEIDGVQGFRVQPQAYLLHVAAGMTAAISNESTPKRRGVYRLDQYQMSTSFPFGIFKRAAIRRQADTVMVFPPLGDVDPHLIRQFRSAETTGHNLKPKLGGMDEFFGLKEFRTGESPRFIYWKRSAHTGHLVSREMTQVSPPRILVVIDTFNPRGEAKRAVEIEKSIAQAASMISAALDSGLAIGLVARGSEWVSISAGRGKRHRRELLTKLAILEPNTVHDAHTALGQAGAIGDASTTIVLFTGGKESTVSQGNRRGAGVIVGCDSEQAGRWFRFDPSIRFESVGPWASDDATT